MLLQARSKRPSLGENIGWRRSPSLSSIYVYLPHSASTDFLLGFIDGIGVSGYVCGFRHSIFDFHPLPINHHLHTSNILRFANQNAGSRLQKCYQFTVRSNGHPGMVWHGTLERKLSKRIHFRRHKNSSISEGSPSSLMVIPGVPFLLCRRLMWSGCVGGEKAMASIGCLAYASISFQHE